jgi:GNAT superfamily N-acetyltransferase
MSVVSIAFQVREARPGDLEQLCAFARDFLTKLHIEASMKDVPIVFERILSAPDLGIILVAEHKAELCGYAYAAFLWRTEFGQTMDLVTLYTAESWRKKGVGRSLVSALVDIAKQRHIRRISAEVRPENYAIERTLESSGFDPERRTLWGMRI